MNETNHVELMKAIKVHKEKYGIYTPLDMFKLDEIIEELREEEAKNRKKKGEK